MNNKIFTSDNGWFTLTLPDYWDQYELEDEEGTYGFFNSKAEDWTGNLRVTLIKLTSDKELHDSMTATYLDKQIQEKAGAIRIMIGNFDCVFYKEDSNYDPEGLLLYYWLLKGKDDVLIYSSFTIDRNKENSEANQNELLDVINILRSIQIK